MSTNSNFLVLCHDTATGFARVGWAAEYPPGRFVHLALVCETENCKPITQTSPYYPHYLSACDKAKQLNLAVLNEQIQANCSKGWMRVPLDLGTNLEVKPDEFGSYQIAAMRTLRRLTDNCLEIWAVIDNQAIIQIASRQPVKSYKELEYQVWKHHTLSELRKYAGNIVKGHLVVQESGLWFQPDIVEDKQTKT